MGGDVDVERGGPVLLEPRFVLESRIDERHTGVVHDDVEAATPADRGDDQRPQLLDVGDVARDAQRSVGAVNRADLFHHVVDARRGDVGDDDPSTFIGEQLRRRATHPARRTGHDGDLPGDRPGQPRQAPRRMIRHARTS
jgi:hypothetical protein